jgi:hypothetical protein
MNFKLIPKLLGWIQFVILVYEHGSSQSYMILFEITNNGFHNVYGIIPPKYGVELCEKTTDIIIDGVDEL